MSPPSERIGKNTKKTYCNNKKYIQYQKNLNETTKKMPPFVRLHKWCLAGKQKSSKRRIKRPVNESSMYWRAKCEPNRHKYPRGLLAHIFRADVADTSSSRLQLSFFWVFLFVCVFLPPASFFFLLQTRAYQKIGIAPVAVYCSPRKAHFHHFILFDLSVSPRLSRRD